MCGIVVLLGDLLSLQQSLADHLEDLVPAGQQCIHHLRLGGSRLIRQQGGGGRP
jgi:hypothetical protein